MIARRAFCALLCLSALALAGCDSGNGVGAAAGPTQLRVINLIPDAPSIIVMLDSDPPLVAGLAYQGLTTYININQGLHELKVSVDGGATNIIDTTFVFLNGVAYTFIVYGPVDSVHSAILLDTTTLFPDGGTFDVRATNLAIGSTGVDVYLTTPGVDLAQTAPVVAGVTLGSTSAFFPVTTPTDTYELRITAVNTKDVIYDALGVPFTDKQLAEIIVYGTGSSQLVDAAVLNIDTTGTGQVFPSLLAEFKFLNATSLSSAVNVFVDGVLTLANVPFAGASSYQKTSAGPHNIAVQSTATPGADLITILTNLPSASDSSIVVSGAAGSLQGLVLSDNNLPAALGRARLRFINASPELAAMDVYVNFVKQFSGVVSNSSSAYTELAADDTVGTSYQFDFNLAGTTNRVLQLPATIVAGKTYSVYVVGQAAALQGVLVADD
jgi:hypothetical protein